MPNRCTNGKCTSTDAPIPLGNGRLKCMACFQVTVVPHETRHWDNPRFAEGDQ